MHGIKARTNHKHRQEEFQKSVQFQVNVHLQSSPNTVLQAPGTRVLRSPFLLGSNPRWFKARITPGWQSPDFQAQAAGDPWCSWVIGAAKYSGWGPTGLRAHSPLCLDFPVIRRRRWVLLVRVALGGFLESCARRGCFLLTFFRLCACSVAVREEMLWEK